MNDISPSTDCYGDSLLRCSPEKCIADVFRDDGILNCPPPKCSDESNCVNHEKPTVISVSGGSSSGSGSGTSGTAHIVVPIVVVIAVLIGLLCCCKKKKAATNSQPPNSAHVEELRPTARSDLDSYLEFQDVRRIPAGTDSDMETHDVRNVPFLPNQRDNRFEPNAPQEEHSGPMPLVPPSHRYDRSTPSAPYASRDDPPAYDSLFNSNTKSAYK